MDTRGGVDGVMRMFLKVLQGDSSLNASRESKA